MVVVKEFTDSLNSEYYTAAITVANVPIGTPPARTTKIFYGDFFPTEMASIQDAYYQGLKYLVDEGFLLVDDYNYATLKKKEGQLLQLTSWKLILEDSPN